jgi:hypothetical protein
VKTGDHVSVVLDCVTEEIDGRLVARVFVRLVDAPPGGGRAPLPPELPGARRNVVNRWLGVADDQTGYAAFGIDCGPAPAADDPMPVFVIKGKDQLAPDAVAAYQNACVKHGLSEQAKQASLALDEIARWQTRHPELVKAPDHKHVPASSERHRKGYTS